MFNKWPLVLLLLLGSVQMVLSTLLFLDFRGAVERGAVTRPQCEGRPKMSLVWFFLLKATQYSNLAPIIFTKEQAMSTGRRRTVCVWGGTHQLVLD